MQQTETTTNRLRLRIAVTLFYFSHGLCFATWASRIPDIKTMLHLSDGSLGTILFALPVGQLVIMPFSGVLVTRFGSHKTLIVSLILYTLALTNMGLATTAWQLALALFIFGLAGNVTNISVNTQGVYAENLYGKIIMSSFHGAWSTAGFTGALIGLLMISLQLTPYVHFWIISGVVFLIIALNSHFLPRVAEKKNVEKKKGFTRPDSFLIWIGIIGFCSMASEGAMFDWSGVYFKDVIGVEGSLVILGYTSFMIMMASGRFLGDRMVRKVGRKRLMQVSGVMISTGLFTSVLFPYIIPSTIAFMMVGLGVSSIVPIVYSLAGRNAKIPPSIALTIVSSVSFLGFLMGPPLIGHIAALSSLRISFAVVGIFGFFITFMVGRIKGIE